MTILSYNSFLPSFKAKKNNNICRCKERNQTYKGGNCHYHKDKTNKIKKCLYDMF